MTSYPGWVATKVGLLGAYPPRYESSWYGVWNEILTVCFPGYEDMVVKPQSKIRPEPDSEAVMRSLGSVGRLSFESDGGNAIARGAGGVERGILVPDFVVARAMAGADATLLIVEIKTTRLTRGQLSIAMDQLGGYATAAMAVKGLRSIYGLLATGPTATLRKFSSSGVGSEEMTGMVGADSLELYRALRSIAGNPPREPQGGPGVPLAPSGRSLLQYPSTDPYTQLSQPREEYPPYLEDSPRDPYQGPSSGANVYSDTYPYLYPAPGTSRSGGSQAYYPPDGSDPYYPSGSYR